LQSFRDIDKGRRNDADVSVDEKGHLRSLPNFEDVVIPCEGLVGDREVP
jgi:hypothetical protein